MIRIAEHAGRSCRINKILAVPPHSVIRDHAEHTCDAPINLSNFKILGSAKKFNELRILESLHIFKDRPSLNSSGSSYFLPTHKKISELI